MSYWALVFVACIVEIRVFPWGGQIGSALGDTFIAAVIGSILISVYFRRARREASHA